MSAAQSQSPGYAVVVGMGRTGLSVARYLAKAGWRLAVMDDRAAPPEAEAIRSISPEIVVHTGSFDHRLVHGARMVVASPGVALGDPIFAAAKSAGADVLGDIELFAGAADAPVVGITGTNGKSTVTTLVGRMAERSGVRVRVGGNLGQPALDLLGRGPTDLYVLELSSFQLEATSSLRLKAGAVLNLSADHMDRYGSLEEYAAAKARIFAHAETAIINADDAEVCKMPRAGQRTFRFSVRAGTAAEYTLAEDSGQTWLTARGELVMPVSALKIVGRHNAANALASLAIGDALRLPRDAMVDELEEFAGLPHRTQFVADVRGVRYVNDSKGTNVGATVAAVVGMPGPLIVIVGGDGKNQDFTPLAANFRGKVRRAVLIGRDARTIATVVADVCDIEFCKTLEDAVRAAARAAQPGDTVLLSPACSSLDMFRDYTHRGSVFTAAVRELAA